MVIVIEIYKILYKLIYIQSHLRLIAGMDSWMGTNFSSIATLEDIRKIDGRRFILGKAMDIAT